MNGLSYMDSSVVFVYIGCTSPARPPVHCNAPLKVPGLGPWEMCYTTTNEHALPSTFSVSGNVRSSDNASDTRPQTHLWPRESGAALQSTLHTTHVLHYDMHVPVSVGVSTIARVAL
jgi:hypothetical protein